MWQLYDELFGMHERDDGESTQQATQIVIGIIGASFVQTGKDYTLLYGRPESFGN